ncbi:MAG: aminotransferase class I/II-fold pyridoxal phosphate-dependent enzyme, partial [Prochlorothrix sp.]
MDAAQRLAAQTFGADRTWFLVNGSTAGVMAAILATCGPGDKILLPRNSHRSALAGLIFSGAMPVFVNPVYAADWDLWGTLTPDQVAHALDQHPDLKAVLLLSPTYQGVGADIAAIAALTHTQGIPLLVDEAHGAHWGFHPDLPPRALSQGADLSVQSIHKTLSSLSQSAMVHTCGDRVSPQRLNQALALLQSSSPNALLLASLDAARHQMATAGLDLMAQTLHLAHQAQSALAAIPGLRVWQLAAPRSGFWTWDPTRLTVEVAALGRSGFAVDDWLVERGILAELPSLRHLTFIISLGNTAADLEGL